MAELEVGGLAQRRRAGAAGLRLAVHAGRASPRPDNRGDTGQPAWRCSSCRAGLSATELAGGFGVLGVHALPGRIEESYIRRLEALPEDVRLLLLVAAAEPIGDPLLLLTRVRASRDRGLGSRGGDRRVAGARRARDLPSSVGALSGVPVRGRARAPGGASGAGGGDRPGCRSRSSCVASGRRGGGSRRGGRAGVGAIRGSCAGARRPRRRGGVPAASGCADRRPGAASRQGARRRRGQPGGGHVRRCAGAAGGGGGRAAGRTPARASGPASRRGRLLREPWERRSGPASPSCEDARAARSAARA